MAHVFSFGTKTILKSQSISVDDNNIFCDIFSGLKRRLSRFCVMEGNDTAATITASATSIGFSFTASFSIYYGN